MSKSGSGQAARGTGTRSGGGNGRTGNSVSGGGGGSSRARVSLSLVTETRNQGTQGVPEYTNRGNQSLNQTAGNKVTQAQVNAINNPAPKAAATTQTAAQRLAAGQQLVTNITPTQLLKMAQSTGYKNYAAQQLANNGGAKSSFSGSTPDTMTGLITKMNGMNNPPQVVSASQFDKMTKGMTIMYRAVGNQNHVNQFQTGANAFDGQGIYGNGHYAAIVNGTSTAAHNQALSLAHSYGSANATMKIALPNTAKVIDYHAVVKQMAKDPKWSKVQHTGSKLSNDMVSAYAASKGYDAIRANSGIMNILNRSILIVKKGSV